MRTKILKTLAKLHAQHPWKMVILVLVMTIIFGAFSTRLEQSMRWSDLLPSKSEKTIQYNKVINEFKRPIESGSLVNLLFAAFKRSNEGKRLIESGREVKRLAEISSDVKVD